MQRIVLLFVLITGRSYYNNAPSEMCHCFGQRCSYANILPINFNKLLIVF